MTARSPLDSRLRSAIVVLGAPNDASGSLSWISLDRCREALGQYRSRPGSVLLPVGGFGQHFNTTPRPHWHYVREFLLQHGVPESDVMVGIDSGNTREDAALTQARLTQLGIRAAVVITSDFHVERAMAQFHEVASHIAYEFVAAHSSGPDDELRRLREHEARSLAAMRHQKQT